jgi:hypothetical protein
MVGIGLTTSSKEWRPKMRVVIAALLVLSVVTGITAEAKAFDAKQFYNLHDRQGY